MLAFSRRQHPKTLVYSQRSACFVHVICSQQHDGLWYPHWHLWSAICLSACTSLSPLNVERTTSSRRAALQPCQQLSAALSTAPMHLLQRWPQKATLRSQYCPSQPGRALHRRRSACPEWKIPGICCCLIRAAALYTCAANLICRPGSCPAPASRWSTPPGSSTRSAPWSARGDVNAVTDERLQQGHLRHDAMTS